MTVDDILDDDRPILNLSGRAVQQASSTCFIPSAPRIYVPYCAIDRSDLPDSVIGPAGSDRAAFNPNDTPQWVYENRRTAQEIVPRVFLGPTAAAKNKTYLQTHGINLTMGIQYHPAGSRAPKVLMHGAGLAAKELGIPCFITPTEGDHELLCRVKEMVAAMSTHLNSHAQNKVLIFDETGNERAAVVVSAYILETYPELGHVKAMQAVHSCRRCVAFTDAHKELMQTYDGILQAQHDVFAARRGTDTAMALSEFSNGGTATPQSAKRARSMDRHVEMDPQGTGALLNFDAPLQDDFERFADRQFAPFVDAP